MIDQDKLEEFNQRWLKRHSTFSIRWPGPDHEWTGSDKYWPFKKGATVWITDSHHYLSAREPDDRGWRPATVVGALLVGGSPKRKFAYITAVDADGHRKQCLPGLIRPMTALEQLAFASLNAKGDGE